MVRHPHRAGRGAARPCGTSSRGTWRIEDGARSKRRPHLKKQSGGAAILTDLTQERIFFGGGEQRLSTASDYMRFALMLTDDGEGNGVRLLLRKTEWLMGSDHLGPAWSQGPKVAQGLGYRFGLTVAARTAAGMAGYPFRRVKRQSAA